MHRVDVEKMKKFETLFGLTKKRDIESFCNTLTITSTELAALIERGIIGALDPYEYHRNHIRIEPEHLIPTEGDRLALLKNGVGQLEGKAKKLTSKIGSMFDQRKLINIHTFYNPTVNYWHMFYFSQRDTGEKNNHWVEGSHIHYTHDTFVTASLVEVLAKINQDKPKLPKSIHIKYSE